MTEAVTGGGGFLVRALGGLGDGERGREEGVKGRELVWSLRGREVEECETETEGLGAEGGEEDAMAARIAARERLVSTVC